MDPSTPEDPGQIVAIAKLQNGRHGELGRSHSYILKSLDPRGMGAGARGRSHGTCAVGTAASAVSDGRSSVRGVARE